MLWWFGVHSGNLLFVFLPVLHRHRIVSDVIVPNFNFFIVPKFVFLCFLLEVNTLIFCQGAPLISHDLHHFSEGHRWIFNHEFVFSFFHKKHIRREGSLRRSSILHTPNVSWSQESQMSSFCCGRLVLLDHVVAVQHHVDSNLLPLLRQLSGNLFFILTERRVLNNQFTKTSLTVGCEICVWHNLHLLLLLLRWLSLLREWGLLTTALSYWLEYKMRLLTIVSFRGWRCFSVKFFDIA